MKRLSCLIALVSLLGLARTPASPADAQRIQKNYEAAMNRWSLDMNAATTPEDRSKLWAARPDALPVVREMWRNIAGSLNQEWTLTPAAWFLRIAPGLTANDANGTPQPIFRDNCDTIRKAIEDHQLKSLKLIPVCSALASSPDPRSLALLEKIQEANPDPKIQGVAALGAAMQLKALGDNPEIMSKRLNYLRKAIIQSADVQLDGTPVSSLAEDELYIIRFLTKGRVAPDLKGVDSAGSPLSLSSWQGKVIVLVFWNSNVSDSQKVVDITTALAKNYQDKPLQVVGVNNDTTAKLRTLQANGTVTFPNFSDPENKLSHEFRVGTWPLVYVLDAERKVQYAGALGSFVEFTAQALLDAKKPAAPTEKR